MKGEQRLDATLDRTAREAVGALSKELSGPVAREVGKEVCAHLDPVTTLLRNETSALSQGAKALREAVSGLEDELVRKVEDTVTEAGAQATERMINGAKSALGEQLKGSVETLGAAVDRLHDDVRQSFASSLGRLEAVDASLGTLHAAGERAAAVQDAANAQLPRHLEALDAARASQRSVVDGAAQGVRSLADEMTVLRAEASEHRVQTAQAAQSLARVEDGLRQLREAHGVSERHAIARQERALGQLQDLFRAAEAGHLRRDRFLAGLLTVLVALTVALIWKVLLPS